MALRQPPRRSAWLLAAWLAPLLAAGCTDDDAAPQAGGEAPPLPGPVDNGTLAGGTLVDQDWTYTNPAQPDVFVHDVVIAAWDVPANATGMWINITLTQEPFTLFASNGAYRGPNGEYDQDAFNAQATPFHVDAPAEGRWTALYRTSRMEPNGVHAGHVTVTLDPPAASPGNATAPPPA